MGLEELLWLQAVSPHPRPHFLELSRKFQGDSDGLVELTRPGLGEHFSLRFPHLCVLNDPDSADSGQGPQGPRFSSPPEGLSWA